MLAILISGSSAFSKTSLNIWKFTVHVLLKPGLENFEHYFTSVDGPRDYHKSDGGKQVPQTVTVASETMTQRDVSMEQRQTHRHGEQACGCSGGGGEEERTGSVGLAVANYYIQGG